MKLIGWRDIIKLPSDIKERLAKLKYYKNRCYICHKKFGKYFVFHHLKYIENDVTYDQFNNTEKYHIALEPMILKTPKRFILLCRPHHKYIEWAKSIKDEKKWKRFCKARKLSM